MTDDNCSFCSSHPETLSYFFWTVYTRRLLGKSLNFIFILFQKNLFPYLLLIAKLYLWDCRRTSKLPEIIGLKHKIKTKFEIERDVSIKNNTLDTFKRKWTINCNLLLKIQYFFLLGIILCTFRK